MKKLVSILLVMILTIVLIPSTTALTAEEGSSTGSFSVGGTAPHIDAFQVYSDAACTLAATSFTPQVTYYAKITVSDANTLNDIQQLVVKAFYDSDGSNPDESTRTTGNSQSAAIYTWTKASNAWALSAGANTTWSTVTASNVAPNMSNTSGDWILAFKVGKVATESVGSANWDLHVKVTDGTYLTHGFYARDRAVLWYGQITVNTSNIDFGVVNVGTGFADNVNEVANVSVLCVVNGDFYGRMKSSSTWTGSNHTASYDNGGTCSNPAEFSLKGYQTDSFANALQITTAAAGVNIAEQTQTTEAGLVHDTLTLWLKVASVFEIDAYSGTITFMVANR
ncbi:MAG: hypothetical protein JW712_09895 [Dehalococcoidales bacterium]|nr:hypothetical protein [Dehalococcoidales bacterium]